MYILSPALLPSCYHAIQSHVPPSPPPPFYTAPASPFSNCVAYSPYILADANIPAGKEMCSHREAQQHY
jgi:hypothetical protein